MPYEGEFANKAAHSDMLKNPEIQDFLAGCEYLRVPSEEEGQTLALATWLEKNGILASAIRFPTVASGMARVRLALSTAHSWEDIRHLATVILSWKDAETS